MEDLIMATKSGKEIVISQELKDMLSSLPKEMDILVPHVYQYKGFWFDPIYLHGLLACHQHFQPKSTKVLLATPPKSGTTWFKGILYSLLNRSVHPPQQKNHPLLACNPHGLVPFLETLDPARFNLPVASCHFPFSALPDSVKDDASDCKIVYVCRGIKDTFVSLWNFSNKAKRRPEPLSLNEAFDLFCRGVSIFGPVWEHILGYWDESKKRPNKVLVIKYEEAKAQPQVELRRLADFLGCPFSQEEEKTGVVDQITNLCSFGSMSKLEVNLTGKCVAGLTNNVFFRKGEVGDWEKHLTPEMAAKLEAITQQKFNGCGLLP